jgi:hypothetical protein
MPTAPVVYIMCYRHQTVAPNIHALVHILRLEKAPHMDSWVTKGTTCRKDGKLSFVKDKIILNVPDSQK